MNKSARQQEIFAHEYLKDLNQSRAAIAAGYSAKGAHVAGHRLLQNATVKTILAEQGEKRLAAIDCSADRVLKELRYIAFSNMLDYITIQPDGEIRLDLSKTASEQAAAIQEFRIEFGARSGDGRHRTVKHMKLKVGPKLRALELLARHCGLLGNRRKASDDGSLVNALAAAGKRAGP